jgi:hypothetical protein
MIRWPFLLAAFLLANVPTATCQSHYYLPLEQGNDMWYANAHGGTLSWHLYIRGYEEGASCRIEEDLTYGSRWCTLLSGNDEGDVFIVGSCDPIDYLGEPLMLIDSPLYVGKSWGRSWGEWNQYYSNYGVAAEEDIQVQAGTFHCYHVINAVYDGSTSYELHYHAWYADGVGLVRFSWPCFWCDWGLAYAIIPVEQDSWGGVKSMYR